MTDQAPCGHEMEWAGCYSGNWGYWVDDAMSHPAKMAPGLCHRIFDHLEELGLLEADSVVMDPLAGTGTSGLVAASRGYRAILVELEPKFIDTMVSYNCPGIPKITIEVKELPADVGGWRTEDMSMGRGEEAGSHYSRLYYAQPVKARKRYKVHSACRCGKPDWHPVHHVVSNIEHLTRRLGHPLDITVIQGDSRHLAEMLQNRGLVAVTSPPYAHPMQFDGERKRERIQAGETLGQRDDVYFSPGNKAWQGLEAGYGSASGQIGNLPDRPMKVVVSPPYGHPAQGLTEDEYQKKREIINKGRLERGEIRGGIGRSGALGASLLNPTGYGDTEGQIGALPDRPLTAITSPPYESRTAADYTVPYEKAHNSNYGESQGQIGQERNETYLSAMRQVFGQIALVADVLVSVSKDPTRGGKLRSLGTDLQRLMEETGWRIVCHHHAILFSEQEQGHLFEGTWKQVKGRMSFFRRLAWRKGSICAMWEDVLFAVKKDSCIPIEKIADARHLPISTILEDIASSVKTDFSQRQPASVSQDTSDRCGNILGATERPLSLGRPGGIMIDPNGTIPVKNPSDIMMEQSIGDKVREAGLSLLATGTQALGDKGIDHMLGADDQHEASFAVPLGQIHLVDGLSAMNFISQSDNYLLISQEQLDGISLAVGANIAVSRQQSQKVCLGLRVNGIKEGFIIRIDALVPCWDMVGLEDTLVGSFRNTEINHQVSGTCTFFIASTKLTFLLNCKSAINKPLIPDCHFKSNYTLKLLNNQVVRDGATGGMTAVTSAPFLDIVAAQDKAFYTKKCTQTGRNPSSPHAQGIDSYGNTPGQIGKLKG